MAGVEVGRSFIWELPADETRVRQPYLPVIHESNLGLV